MIKLGVGVMLAVAAACGKPKPPPPSTSPDAAVVAIADAAPAVDAKPPRKPVQPWGPAGSCQLKVFAKPLIDQADGMANITASDWYTDEDRPKDDPKDSFLINCSGATVQVTIASPRGGAELGPKRYVNDAKAKPLNIQAVVDGVVMEGPVGFLDVTAFDHHHIAATLAITGKLAGKPTKLAGTIAFDCPGYLGCN